MNELVAVEDSVSDSDTVTVGDAVTVGDSDAAFSAARGVIEETLKTLRDAVPEMFSIAYASQDPKAYEALNSLLRTMMDAGAHLADIEIKEARATALSIQNKKAAAAQTEESANIDFRGTIDQLQRALRSAALRSYEE